MPLVSVSIAMWSCPSQLTQLTQRAAPGRWQDGMAGAQRTQHRHWQPRLVLGMGVISAMVRRCRRGSRLWRSAALLDGTVTAVGLDGESPSPEAPPAGSRTLDELGFLIRNPFARGLEVTSCAGAELQASPAEVWKIIEGLPDSWLSLQLTDCYGLPWPLKLQSLRGRLEASSELEGDVAAFGQVIRQFQWKVQKADFADFTGEVQLLGKVLDEPGSFTHTIRISPRDAGSRVESTVQYAPSAPLQTLLNALGGRFSQHEGNVTMLRRLGGLADGDVVYDPMAFYNLIGRLIDLVAPFEDVARESLTRLSGIKGDGPQVKVLEIGCGSGRWAKSLFPDGGDAPVSNVSQYLGVDYSSTMSNESARCLSQIQTARVVRGDARRDGLLAEACASFFGAPDRIVASYVLDILDEKDLQRVMSQCATLLRSSGGLFAAASIFPGSPLMELWESIWQTAPTVVGGCRPKDIRAKLQSLGWQVIATEVTDVLGYRSQVVLAKPPA